MHCIPETPPTKTHPRPSKGPLGDPPDPGPTQTSSYSSEVETAAGSTPPASALPWQVVVPGPSLKEVIVQLLAQVSPGYIPPGTPEKISTVLQETRRLLASSFPWVRVTGDWQQANCLLQPTAPCQVAGSILARLEQALLPRERLAGALVTAPHVLNYYMSYLVAVSVAQLVPHQLQATQEDLQRVVRAVRSIPPGSMLTVSSDLVDTLLVQLILKLQPLHGDGYRQLGQQKLLALTLQLSALTLEALRRMPGVTVDTALPRPSWDLRRLTFQAQSRLMQAFGTFYQVKKLMAAGNPDLIRCIPREVIEVVLAQHPTACTEGTPVQAPKVDEDLMESRLFRQTLPETERDPIFQEFGTWVRHTMIYRKALPEMSDDVIADYRHMVIPRPSSYTTWVNGKYFVGDDYKEVTSLVDNVSLAHNAFVVDGSGEALQRDFQNSHKLLQGLTQSEPSSPQESGQGLLAFDPVLSGALLPPAAQPLPGYSANAAAAARNSVSTTEKVLIQRSTAERVVEELFRGQDQTFYQSQARKYRAFEKELVEHVYLVLEKEAEAYRNNRVFKQTLERLMDPVQEVKLAVELRRPLRQKLIVALPNTWLTREGLMQDPQVALLACSLVAREVLNHIKPSVSFSAEVQGRDNTPYSINVPVRKPEEGDEERALTLLEERLHKENNASREEFLACPDKDPEEKEVKTKKRNFSWLCRLFSCKKN
ncbi:unnamed protein product [Gadus morhua 'NCC']